MFVIEENGDLFINQRYQGTAWRPKGVHPEALGLVARWKELHELGRKIASNLFRVTFGKTDEDELSAALRFAVPNEGWKVASKLDKDLRKLLIDLHEMGYENVELDAEIPIDTDGEMIWTLSTLAFGEEPILELAAPMRMAAQAVKSTRLEEFLITPVNP